MHITWRDGSFDLKNVLQIFCQQRARQILYADAVGLQVEKVHYKPGIGSSAEKGYCDLHLFEQPTRFIWFSFDYPQTQAASYNSCRFGGHSFVNLQNKLLSEVYCYFIIRETKEQRKLFYSTVCNL